MKLFKGGALFSLLVVAIIVLRMNATIIQTCYVEYMDCIACNGIDFIDMQQYYEWQGYTLTTAHCIGPDYDPEYFVECIYSIPPSDVIPGWN
jgi:hypothetical protein